MASSPPLRCSVFPPAASASVVSVSSPVSSSPTHSLTRRSSRPPVGLPPRSFSPLPPVANKAQEWRQVRPSPATEAPHQAPMEAVERYVSQELRLVGLGLPGGGRAVPATASTTDPKAAKQRLGIYKNGFAMLGRFMAADARSFVERIFSEYDLLLAHADRAVKDSSLEAERRRLEEVQAQQLAVMRADLEADLERRARKVQQAEEAIKAVLRRLEADKTALELENGRMRAQQADEHERILMMSQSVVDARLAAQISDTNHRAVQRQLEVIKKAESSKLDLLSDLSNMQNLLREHSVPYKCKLQFLFDSNGDVVEVPQDACPS